MIKQSDALKRFNLFVREFDACYHKAAVNAGLSDSAMNIMYLLCTEGDGCYQKSLYLMTGISKQTINSSIKKMEKDGLLTLVNEDGRNTRAFLTDKGRRLAKEKIIPIINAEIAVFDSWSEKDRKEFHRLNMKYLNDIKQRLES